MGVKMKDLKLIGFPAEKKKKTNIILVDIAAFKPSFISWIMNMTYNENAEHHGMETSLSIIHNSNKMM